VNEHFTAYAMIGLLIISVEINTCINDMQRIKGLEREISLYKKVWQLFAMKLPGIMIHLLVEVGSSKKRRR